MSETTLPAMLQAEIRRCTELLQAYQAIPSGRLAEILIRQDLDAAYQAIADNDTVAMIRAYHALQDRE